MANFVVTTASDIVDSGDGAISLREALALAQSTAGADRITFSKSIPGISSIVFVDLKAELLVTDQGGAVTINGDVDNDGQADVILNAGSNRHVTVNAGADLTIIGIDFWGARETAVPEPEEHRAQAASTAHRAPVSRNWRLASKPISRRSTAPELMAGRAEPARPDIGRRGY